jgi:hypothetical protein
MRCECTRWHNVAFMQLSLAIRASSEQLCAGTCGAADLSLFIMAAKWSDLRLFEQARGLIWWWPMIVAQAEAGPQGGAWQIPFDQKGGGELRRLFPDLPA